MYISGVFTVIFVHSQVKIIILYCIVLIIRCMCAMSLHKLKDL